MRELPSPGELSLTEAAMRLRADYQSTRNRMLRGDLPGRRIGTRWYVKECDVARLEALRSEPVAQPA